MFLPLWSLTLILLWRKKHFTWDSYHTVVSFWYFSHSFEVTINIKHLERLNIDINCLPARDTWEETSCQTCEIQTVWKQKAASSPESNGDRSTHHTQRQPGGCFFWLGATYLSTLWLPHLSGRVSEWFIHSTLEPEPVSAAALNGPHQSNNMTRWLITSRFGAEPAASS